ncbi:hypothetical protein MMC30_001475 [Trapelia coarctata]|nr:hypothetical protein [Trapelia coarctata]
MLPEDLLIFLDDQIPCRKSQIRQIASLLGPDIPSPPTLVLHGLEATGKSLTTEAVLAAVLTSHAIVRSRECITARHLLERTVLACRDALNEKDRSGAHKNVDGRCESVTVLVVQLQQLLQGQKKFVLVFDGIDRQREAPPTLLPALARLGEIIPNLTIVLIVTAPRPRFLHLAGVPHIYFPPYDRSESLTILSRMPQPIFSTTSTEEDLPEEIFLERQEDDAWLWSRFCGAVWESLGKGAARDIMSFASACGRLWEPFVQPIRDGLYGTRDFSKLIVRNRALFQGETALVERLVPVATADAPKKTLGNPHTLPYYTSHLLLAAYLASHNPSRLDSTFFMKAASLKRRKRRTGPAAPKTRPSKHRKIQRKLLGPQAFILERMLAIFHAIVPDEIPGGTGDVMAQMAMLASRRLLVKTAAAADVLEQGTKWRVNVGWEYIVGVARGVRFELEGWLVE